MGKLEDTDPLIRRVAEFLAPVNHKVQGDLCRNNSYAYMYNLNRGVTWASKMWDSSARLQSGLFTGNLNSLGNFDECVNIKDIEDATGVFSGQHCIATFQLSNISATDAMGKMIKDVMEEEEDISIGLGSLLSKGLHWGYCIPSSCSSQDLKAALSEYLGGDSGVNVIVSNTDCHFEGEKHFSAVDWIAIAIFTMLLLAVVLSTGYEFMKDYLSEGGYWDIPLPGLPAPVRGNPFLPPKPSVPPERTGSIVNIPCTSGSVSSPEHARRLGIAGTARPTSAAELRSSPTASHKLQPEERSQSLCVPKHTQLGVQEEVRSQSLDLSKEPQVPQRPDSLGSSGSIEIPCNVFPVLSQPSQMSSQMQPQSRPSTPTPLTQPQTRPQSLDLPIESTASQAQEVQRVPPSVESQPQSRENEPAQIEIEEVEREIPVLRPPSDASPAPIATEADYDAWAAFSVLSNWWKIFHFEEQRNTLQSLYGIKFLSICWVLIGHTCLIAESLPAMNYVDIKSYASQWSAMLILNASLAVDTFVVVTGVLLSYNFLKDMKKRGIYRRRSNNIARTGMTKKFFCKYFVVSFFHRYARLTPALAVMVLFQVSLLGWMGSGPFWDSGNGYLSDICHDYWWVTLGYLQTYIGGERVCLPQTWYLRVDMQLYVISPLIFLYLLAWNKKRSFILLSTLAFVGIICSFFINFFLKLPVGVMSGDASKWSQKNLFDIQATHTRIAPWMIGIGAGYLLYLHRRRGRTVLYLTPWVRVIGWCLSSLALLLAVFGVLPFQQINYEYNALWSSLYSSLHHTIWALGIGWIIIACESDYGGFVQVVLSWKVFQPLGRLTYCIFLVHLPLMTSRAFMTRVPIYISKVTAISSVFGDILFSTLLAILLAFLVEVPFRRLFKCLTLKINFPVRQAVPLLVHRSFGERIPLLRDLAVTAYSTIAATILPRFPTPSGSGRESRASTGYSHLGSIAEVDNPTPPSKGAVPKGVGPSGAEQAAVPQGVGSSGAEQAAVCDPPSSVIVHAEIHREPSSDGSQQSVVLPGSVETASAKDTELPAAAAAAAAAADNGEQS